MCTVHCLLTAACVLERETGIEPATNSLEGCDSTTELLPPMRIARVAPSHTRRPKPALSSPTVIRSSTRFAHPGHSRCVCRHGANLAVRRSEPQGESSGGEGRVRTSVARRRQVYSLLRLTALPPPRIFPSCLRRCARGRALVSDVVGNPCRLVPEKKCRRRFRSMELAKGFEPPTG
jgi:hypothetical protein